MIYLRRLKINNSKQPIHPNHSIKKTNNTTRSQDLCFIECLQVMGAPVDRIITITMRGTTIEAPKIDFSYRRVLRKIGRHQSISLRYFPISLRINVKRTLKHNPCVHPPWLLYRIGVPFNWSDLPTARSPLPSTE